MHTLNRSTVKTKKAKHSKRKKPKPELKWQKGKYSRSQQYTVHLPYNFLLLCRLWQVTPELVLIDFMDNVNSGSWKREGRDNAKQHIVQYILAMGYGQQYYTPVDITTMFKELDAMGMLFPKNGNMKLLDKYVDWRDKHNKMWFNKWFTAVRRNINDTTTTDNV